MIAVNPEPLEEKEAETVEAETECVFGVKEDVSAKVIVEKVTVVVSIVVVAGLVVLVSVVVTMLV